MATVTVGVDAVEVIVVVSVRGCGGALAWFVVVWVREVWGFCL